MNDNAAEAAAGTEKSRYGAEQPPQRPPTPRPRQTLEDAIDKIHKEADEREGGQGEGRQRVRRRSTAT